jgi:hypothetical protein
MRWEGITVSFTVSNIWLLQSLWLSSQNIVLFFYLKSVSLKSSEWPTHQISINSNSLLCGAECLCVWHTGPSSTSVTVPWERNSRHVNIIPSSGGCCSTHGFRKDEREACGKGRYQEHPSRSQ